MSGAGSNAPAQALVLALVPEADCARLAESMDVERELDFVCTLNDARNVMAIRGVAVLLCDLAAVVDWREVLEELSGMRHPPFLILVSQFADHRLWGEALNLGAFDVFDKSTASVPAMVQSIKLAAERWSQDSREGRG